MDGASNKRGDGLTGSPDTFFRKTRGNGLSEESISPADALFPIVLIGGFTHLDRGKTVSKLFVLELLGLALSEKQMPQIVETTRSVEN